MFVCVCKVTWHGNGLAVVLSPARTLYSIASRRNPYPTFTDCTHYEITAVLFCPISFRKKTNVDLDSDFEFTFGPSFT